ncbi:MAG: ABC transporter ATP-binding protein [Dethiobacteria bacterium]|nr:ABC transporter ATP-binding protein [Bacillota bacterium]
MTAIRFKNVSTPYSLQAFSLTINPGELFVVLGATGAGKTTLLNVISGLTTYTGSVYFDGQPADRLPVQKRRIGYLFQDLCLFPHMNVFKNVAFSLRRLQLTPQEAEVKVNNILSMLGIKHLRNRYPKNLSGGEKQRVALARALVHEPQILLLDEPFNNLDQRTAKKLMMELKYLQKELAITTIFVTHNFYEAEVLADRVVVLENGCIEQVGTVEEIFFNPTPRVRGFIGDPNILDCEGVYPLDHGLVLVKSGEISLVMSDEGFKVKKLAIAPEDLHLTTRPAETEFNKAKGILESVKEEDFTYLCTVLVGKQRLRVRVPKEEFSAMLLQPGDQAWLIFNPRQLKLCFKEEPGVTLPALRFNVSAG